MEFKITVLPGDGIGPEIMAEALKVLTAAGAKFGHKFRVKSCLIGGAAIDETGEPCPRRRWTIACGPTRCSWARWAGPNGKISR